MDRWVDSGVPSVRGSWIPPPRLISPAFIVLTLITNCLVCVVLLKPQMRNCTNVLLVAMAFSDTLTGVRLVAEHACNGFIKPAG